MRFEICRHTLASPKVKNEVKFVFISDLHGVEYGPENSKLVAAVLKEKPDAVLVGGDLLVERYHNPTDVPKKLLGKLTDMLPVFAALGNHEHRLDADIREEYDAALKNMGVVTLVDEYSMVTVGDTDIRIWGLDLGRQFYPRWHNVRMAPWVMERHLGTIPKDDEIFELLLAHHPNYIDKYAKWGADAVLSGHIHGGAVRLPVVGGTLSPNFTFFPKYSKGEYIYDKCHLYVSAGLGAHTIKIRINNPPELTVLTLVPEK